jgi:hypothetical protein
MKLTYSKIHSVKRLKQVVYIATTVPARVNEHLHVKQIGVAIRL